MIKILQNNQGFINFNYTLYAYILTLFMVLVAFLYQRNIAQVDSHLNASLCTKEKTLILTNSLKKIVKYNQTIRAINITIYLLAASTPVNWGSPAQINMLKRIINALKMIRNFEIMYTDIKIVSTRSILSKGNYSPCKMRRDKTTKKTAIFVLPIFSLSLSKQMNKDIIEIKNKTWNVFVLQNYGKYTGKIKWKSNYSNRFQRSIKEVFGRLKAIKRLSNGLSLKEKYGIKGLRGLKATNKELLTSP